MADKTKDLLRAIAAGDIELVESLVESGADVNAADEYGSGTLLNFKPNNRIPFVQGRRSECANERKRYVCLGGALLC
jgi:hypothetical protein